MLENVTSARGFGNPVLLTPQPCRLNVLSQLISIFLCLCALPACAHPQSSEVYGLTAYADAIKQSTISDRITAMERYLAMAGGSRLKTDALEFLVWDHMRLGHQAQSVQRAQELLRMSPGNSLAIAVLNQNVQEQSADRRAVLDRLSLLTAAVNRVEQITRPEGMLPRNFMVMRQQVKEMLNGEAGLAYLALKDYGNARACLEPAVAVDPNNPTLVYAMAMALLDGKNPNSYNGYWYLARAANLTEGTPSGQQISLYARNRFRKQGGKDAGWDQYLASAAAYDSPPPLPSAANTADAPLATASVADTGRAPVAKGASAAHGGSTVRSSQTSPVSSSDRHAKSKPSFGFEDTLREPQEASAPSVRPTNRAKLPGAPAQALSLGILIETSLLTGSNGATIIATLKEIVRNMRSNDEACILVFSDQLDFEQDLTADDALLEESLSQIRPRSGQALLSGIAFAAGHLKRIGKNPNRVLLVISDGRAAQTSTDSLMFRSQIAGVRIDLIGMDAEGSTERELLSRLAASSGGKVFFASDARDFRTAAVQITQSLGLPLP